ncbi:MAG: ankyrin repeat domain-containing protein, partial [Stenotrophomonas sp.]
MTEPLRTRAIGALVAGVLLALVAGFGGIAAAVCGLLAQPAFALGVSWWRRTRTTTASATLLKHDFPALLMVWAGGVLLLALLVSWPLRALRDSGSLPAVLALSVAVSIAVLALWRTWPLWQALERDGGTLRTHGQALSARGMESWHGLAAALVLLALCAAVFVPAWPGLLGEGWHWPVAFATALLSAVLHGVLQRLPSAPPAVVAEAPVFDPFAEPPAEPMPLEPLAQHELLPQLYAAARSGRVDRALQLLDAGADPQALPPEDSRDQRSLAVLAAVLPDLRLLRTLIGRGVDVNLAHRGMTPLLAATRDSWHGRPEAVMTLLANGADPRAIDADGNTPLHHAARSSDPGVAALLRDAAAEIDALNHDGHSPLAVACQSGNWRLAKFLLERGAKVEPADGVPVLVPAAATEDDDPAGVQLLLKHKARLDARDRRRRSALHEAASAGHAEIVEVLLNAGANIEPRDAAGRTPWLDAAAQAHAGVLERLLAHQPDLHAVDGEGNNALLLACRAEQVGAALVRWLLELGVARDVAAADGRRAIDHAAAAGRWSIVALLDPDYPLPVAVSDVPGNGENDGSATPPLLNDRAPLELLREALAFGNIDGMRSMAQLCTPAELGGLLHDPELALQPCVVDWLLQHDIALEQQDACGDTPMFALLARGADAIPTLQVLLRHGVSPAG